MSNYIWEKIYKKRKGNWGTYHPEDLIRFIKRLKSFNKEKKKPKLLELGCGPGANTNFLLKEGFDVYGIDLSKTAISLVRNKVKKNFKKNFIIGDFSKLPWKSLHFDGVVDNFSIYANYKEKIEQTYDEVYRVLKKNGFFFSKVWGVKTLGFSNGKKIEKNTLINIKKGPCKKMGISHFFTYNELKRLNSKYKKNIVDKNCYTEKAKAKNYYVEIFISQSFK